MYLSNKTDFIVLGFGFCFVLCFLRTELLRPLSAGDNEFQKTGPWSLN